MAMHVIGPVMHDIAGHEDLVRHSSPEATNLVQRATTDDIQGLDAPAVIVQANSCSAADQEPPPRVPLVLDQADFPAPRLLSYLVRHR